MNRLQKISFVFTCFFAELTLVLAASAGPAAGSGDPGASDGSLTLDAIVGDALANNPELKFYETEIAAAKGRRRAAGEWANPELSAELGAKRVDDLSGNKLGDGAVWSVSVAQTFEFPGRVSLRKAIAGKQIELAELGLDQFRLALSARVRSLGFKVLAGDERVTAAREASDRFHQLLDVLVQREPTGIAPSLELRIIEASSLMLDRRLSQSERERQAARFELNQLRGVPIETDFSVIRRELLLQPPPELVLLLATARERNFDVRTRVVELQQQGFNVLLSENERWPSVTLRPFARNETHADREQEYGLGVSVPLPLFNQNRGNIETAKARQLQAEVSLNVSLRAMERKVAEARFAYTTELAAVERWQPDTLTKLRGAAEQGDRHYRLGALPIATYMELQKQYLDAVDALLETQAEALEARQQLELLSGLELSGKPLSSRQPAQTERKGLTRFSNSPSGSAHLC